jgi:restriction system protein
MLVPRLRAWALLLSSGLWLLLYGWLALRLWIENLALTDRLNLALIALCIGLGVLLALGWRASGGQWWTQLGNMFQRPRWRAMNLAQLQALSPSDFEEYVARRIFERRGYKALNTPDVKDGGIDVLVTDRNGRQMVVQCKRYKHSVGEPVVRDLYGTMIGNGAISAYLVTTGEITEAARLWAAGKPIELIDGQRLVALAR